MNEIERRPIRREYGGNARPQMIAALLNNPKVRSALERRYPGHTSVSPIFDTEGRVVDFRPNYRAGARVGPHREDASPPRRQFKSYGTLVREQRLRQVMLRQVGR